MVPNDWSTSMPTLSMVSVAYGRGRIQGVGLGVSIGLSLSSGIFKNIFNKYNFS